MTPVGRHYESLRSVWAMYVVEVESAIAALRTKATVLTAHNPKAAVAAFQLSVSLDTDGPASIPDEDPKSTQETATALWEAASGIKYDEAAKKRFVEIAKKLEQNELDRVDQIAAMKARAVAKASKFDKRRKKK